MLGSSGGYPAGGASMIPGELLQGYLAPDAAIVDLEEYTGYVSLIRNGEPHGS